MCGPVVVLNTCVCACVCVCAREGLSAVLFFIIIIVRLIIWFCFQHNYVCVCVNIQLYTIPYCNKLYVSEYIVCAYVCVSVCLTVRKYYVNFAALLACVWNICGTHILCMPVGSAFFIVYLMPVMCIMFLYDFVFNNASKIQPQRPTMNLWSMIPPFFHSVVTVHPC